MRCASATSGASALRLLEREDPSVVLLDLNLPDVSGFELLERIHNERPTTPVVVLTAHGEVDGGGRGLRLGATVQNLSMVAKIAGIKLCQSYNRQYDTDFLAVMPTNLYGPNDNFDLETSHVLAALIRKFHLAKLAAQGDWKGIQKDETHYGPIPDDVSASLASISELHGHGEKVSTVYRSPLTAHQSQPKVVLWGSGRPRREFLHVDDLADGCLFLMSREEKKIRSLLTADRLPLLNIGWGKDISIEGLATIIKKTVGFDGDIVFDTTKPDGTPQKLLDVARMAELGWKAKISLREGISRVYEWYLEQF